VRRDWWESDSWNRYEQICGLDPGTRVRELKAGRPRHIVDLTPSTDALWRNVRKSYRPIIHAAEREYEIVTCGPTGMDYFRRLHALDAGRVTRPAESWELMADWVNVGWLILVGAKPRADVAERTAGAGPAASTTLDGWTAFAAFYTCEPAYYGHAASLARNVNHALVWHAMLELKDLGCQWLDMGEVGATDQKGKDLEFFKRGFG